MRVTDKQAAEIIIRDLLRNQQLLLEAQKTLATGKKINKPSDDPIGMRNVLDYRKILSSIDQYTRNIDRGKMQLEITENVLEQVDTLLNQAKREAEIHGAGDVNERRNAADYVKTIYDQLLDIANTRHGDSYIFAGHVTNTAPFSRNADGIDGTADDWVATYDGDNGDVTVIVGENVDVKVNATGQDVFDVGGVGGGTDIFGVLKDLIDALEADPYVPADVSGQIAPLENAINQIQGVAVESAAYFDRLEAAENHLIKYKANVEDMLFETEQADIAQAIVELQFLEMAYEASLAGASKIIQPSLLDFLR